MKRLVSLFFLLLAMCLRGEVVAVENTEGKRVKIDFVSLEGDVVSFKRIGKKKVMKLSLSKLSAASQAELKALAKKIGPPAPTYKIEVVVVKTRKKLPEPSNLVRQEVGGTVKVKNVSRTGIEPETNGLIVFIGESRDEDAKQKYKVLSARKFTVKSKVAKTENYTVKPVYTEFDNLSKANGYRGFQYVGYILTIRMPNGKLIIHKEGGAVPNKAVKSDPWILGDLEMYRAEDLLHADLLLSKEKKKARIKQREAAAKKAEKLKIKTDTEKPVLPAS